MTTTCPTDDLWLARFRADGSAALGQFFVEQGHRLERTIRGRLPRLLWTRVAAADVLQESFLQAHRRLPAYLSNPRLPPHVWLREIALQEVLVAYRRATAGLRCVRREASPSDGWTVPARDHTPEEAAVRVELRERVSALLGGMDGIDREVLTLRYLAGMSNDETAAALGLRKTAASNRCVRALRRLRDRIPADMLGFDE